MKSNSRIRELKEWLAAAKQAAATVAPYSAASHCEDVRSQLNGKWSAIAVERQRQFNSVMSNILKKKLKK